MDECNIPFDPKWKNIALAVSGGADSALLTYLVCNEIKAETTVHIINCVRCWKTKPWQQQDIKNVFGWMKERFPHITFKKHTNFIPPELEWGSVGPTVTDEYGKLVSGDTLELRSFSEFVCVTNNIDVYFNAVTKNPKDVSFSGLSIRDIEPDGENKHLELMIHMGFLVSHPFRFIEKKWILKKYIELGLQDLLNITRSCEGTFTDLNYKNYIPGQMVPVCGECFWCKEREWAIEQTK